MRQGKGTDMITIKDVAKEAGVSIATVSNYLNNKKQFSAATAQRIQTAIDNLNYIVHNSGRELKFQKSKAIGVIFPTISEPYFEHLVSSIKGFFSESDREVILELTDSDPDKETKAIFNLIGRNVSGMLLYTCQPTNKSLFYKIDNLRIPYVLIDRKPSDLDCNYVYSDNFNLFFQLTESLISNGFRKIALVAGPKEYSENKNACSAFLSALEKNHMSPDPDLILFTTAIRECGFRAGMQLLEDKNAFPEIILSTSYRLAEGIRYALRIYHLDGVSQIQIISTGDSMDDVFYHDPTIRKTSRDAYRIGETAGKLLLDNIQSPIIFEKQQISFQDDYNFSEIEPPEKHLPAHISFRDTLKVLLLDDDSSISGLSKLLVDFHAKEHLNVKIEKVPQKEAFSYICNYFENGGSDIDVFLLDIPWLSYLAYKGYLMPLNKFMKEHPIRLGDYLNNSFTLDHPGGHTVYSLPYMACTQLLFYRKDIFSDEKIAHELESKYMIPLKPPKTWLHYNALAKYFTQSINPNSPVKYGHSMAISNPDLLFCDLMPRIWAYGKGLFDKSGNFTLNTLANRKAIKSYLNSIWYSSNGFLEYKPIDAAQRFINGETAMFYTFYNYATEIVNQNTSKIIDKFGYTGVPGSPVCAGWHFAIASNSKKPEAAYMFMRWASGIDIAIPHTILGGQSPHISIYRNYDVVSLYPWLPKALSEVKKSRVRLPQFTASGKAINGNIFAEQLYKEFLPLIHDTINGKDFELEELNHILDKMQNNLRYLFV